MTTPYALRLLCISSAVFFLVHTAVAALVLCGVGTLCLPADSRRAARILFWARVAPPLCGLFAVAALCVPSFLWFEEEAGPETVGALSLAAAALGAALWRASIGRALLAAFRSARYLRSCECIGQPAPLAGSLPVRVLDAPGGLMVLAGIFRPVLVVSRAVVETLEPGQLEAAISHERAHGASRDNLRRLLILLSPGMFPFFRGFRALEETWSRLSEWAADDRAASGDPRRSLALAEALIGVARLGVSAPPHLLASPLLTEMEEIGVRVDRLLRPQPVEPSVYSDRVLQFCAGFVFLAALGAMLMRPGTMEAAHDAIEQLIR